MSRSPGSILLLTVMVIAILTTTTLGAVAIRFDQLSATDRINNSSVAKLAADSGLARLKEQIQLNQGNNGTRALVTPSVYDLETGESRRVADLDSFKPSPRSIVAGYEPAKTSLPRCLAVAVVVPWVNSGTYLFQEDSPSNPGLIFHYANIINDTPLGAIPENDSITSAADRRLPLSELTRLGHFYNPYAPLNAPQGTIGYWTIKMGGPEDEFLTRKNAAGSGSYFDALDFVYIPYLPRIVDTAIATSGGSGTGVDRVDALTYRQKIESVITTNNFKVWLDASVGDDLLYEYGFGDLFTESDDYRIQWLQPSLWNDLPEQELGVVHKSDNVVDPEVKWSRQPQPLLTSVHNTSGWDVDILRGSRSLGFWRLLDNAAFLTPSATVAALYYGPLDGIRLHQKLSVTLLSKLDRQPLQLNERTSDQGRLYNVRITNIAVNGNVVTMQLKLSNSTYDTPQRLGNAPIAASILDSIVNTGAVQPSTAFSLTNVSLNDSDSDGRAVQVTVTPSSDCLPSPSFTACPAVGDLVGLKRSGSVPVWGRVTAARFSNQRMTGFTVDALRAYPKPVRHLASTTYQDGGAPVIAYFGGEIVMNDYDGGTASETDELWLYNPETNAWTYPAQGGNRPGPLAGASMVYDQQNGRLIVFGGYYHEAVSINNIDCKSSPITCLSSNQPGLRIAKRIVNDTFAYTLATGTWERISYNLDASRKIKQDGRYQVKVVSTLADRSGLEGWRWTPRADTGRSRLTLNVNGSTETTVRIGPSPAGIAPGDELYLYSRLEPFNAWARVTAVDYPNGTITIRVHGYSQVAPTVSVGELLIQVLNRQSAAQTCIGRVEASIYRCALQGGTTTGYAVGDQIVLEEFVNGRLVQLLSGYVSHMTTTGVLSFVADERRLELKDFSDRSGAGIIANESAVALPVGRYGATLQAKPGGPQGSIQTNYLWQGNATNIARETRMGEIWQLDFTAGVTSGEASVAWSSTPKAMNNQPPEEAEYSFKVIRTDYQSQIFTPPDGVKAPEIIRDKDTVDPRTGLPTKEWDNAKVWEINIATSGSEAIAPSRLVAGAEIVIERQNGRDGPNPNVRESFHGLIVSTFFNGNGYDRTVVKVRHNPIYSGDTGLRKDSKNATITVQGDYRTDIPITGSDGKVKWVAESGGYIQLSNLTEDERARVPSSGVAVKIWRSAGGRIEAYTMTVRDRSYEPGVDSFRLYSDGVPYRSPDSLAYGSNALVSHNGVDAFSLALSDYQLSEYGYQGPAEWFANAHDANPSWEIRSSQSDARINDRPAPRQSGSLATLYSPGAPKSQLFSVGGTFGRFADLWRMDDAGKMTGNDNGRWQIGKASPRSSEDLPNLFGASLTVYQSNDVTKAVLFGGKLKFDDSSNDYGRRIGARILGEPDLQAFNHPDNAYYLPADATAGTRGFIRTISDNFPMGKVSSDVEDVRNSLTLTGDGLSGGVVKVVCTYLGQVCNGRNDSSPLMQHLGTLGRHSANAVLYGGASWGSAPALLNPGLAFRVENQNGGPVARMISGLSAYSSAQTNGRWEQDGYYPYRCDVGPGCDSAPYGTTGTHFSSDKTLMTAGFAAITGQDIGGSVLVTTTGVGRAIASNRGGQNDQSDRWYSYCADVDSELRCRIPANRYLGWLPDVEDVLFMMNAALTLASTDTYRVIGYHGGAKRGYQVMTWSGKDPIVFEIVP